MIFTTIFLFSNEFWDKVKISVSFDNIECDCTIPSSIFEFVFIFSSYLNKKKLVSIAYSLNVNEVPSAMLKETLSCLPIVVLFTSAAFSSISKLSIATRPERIFDDTVTVTFSFEVTLFVLIVKEIVSSFFI